MTTTLLLFDVDGVLIYPKGYKEALRATVEHFAALMGQRDMAPTYDEIAAFEAAGITNEWDSAPLSVGALLAQALASQPDLVRHTAAATFGAVKAAALPLDRPDYVGLARSVRAETPDGQPPTDAIHTLLRARIDPAAHPLLAEMLTDIYSLNSITTRVFQHYVLGSQRFARTFGLPPSFEAQSTLLAHDRAVLSPDHRARLLKLSQRGDFGFCIYTARPSRPPADLPPDAPVNGDFLYPPEGDLAAELLELQHVPLVAGGRIAWLAGSRGRHPSDYLKPSPVQGLAAIGAAYAGVEMPALRAAADLADHGTLRDPLANLPTDLRVVVFEDSTGGIAAVSRAVDLLRRHRPDLSITFEAIGIAAEGSKRAALQPVATRLAPDINTGLAGVM